MQPDTCQCGASQVVLAIGCLVDIGQAGAVVESAFAKGLYPADGDGGKTAARLESTRANGVDIAVSTEVDRGHRAVRECITINLLKIGRT